jgi:hypothetical protein
MANAAQEKNSALNLHQKMVELRKCVPHIKKEQHSENVTYKYAKIDDVWQAITPKMNELGVTFEVTKESNPTLESMTVKTKYGERLMWIYRADLTVEWTDAENRDDAIIIEIHAVGWNDDPAKAKGAAWTYALKYYLFEKFSVDMGDDDPDNQNIAPEGAGQQQKQQNRQSTGNRPPSNRGGLSEKQIARMNAKAIDANVSKEQITDYIIKKYKKAEAKDLTREEYDELCAHLDAAAAKGGTAK